MEVHAAYNVSNCLSLHRELNTLWQNKTLPDVNISKYTEYYLIYRINLCINLASCLYIVNFNYFFKKNESIIKKTIKI